MTKTYERQIQSKAMPNATLSVNATPESFGAAEARNLQKAGQAGQQFSKVLAQKALEEQAKLDNAVVRDNLNQVRNEVREYITMDVYNRKGESATNVYPEVQKKLEDIKRARLSDFHNENQKKTFLAAFDSLMHGSLDGAARYQEQERANYEKMTIEAENLNYVEDAVADRYNGETIADAEKMISANIRYVNKGMGKEITNKAIEDHVHNLYATVLESLGDDSPEAALGFFNQNFEKFNPKIRSKMKAELDKKANEAWVRNTAITLSSSGLSLEEQLSKVDQIQDVKKADAVRKRVKSRYDEKESIKKAKVNEVVEQEWDELFKDPVQYKIPYNDLPEKTQRAMESFKSKYVKELAAEKGVGKKVQTDKQIYFDLKTMPVEDFMKADLMQYAEKLSIGDFKELVKEQRNARKDADSVTNLRTPYQTAKDAISGIKDLDPKKGVKENTRRQYFYSEFEKRLNAVPENERTEVKQQEIINQLLSPVSTDTGWFDGLGDKTLYRFEVPYLREQREKDLAFEQNIPENLKDYSQVNYDKANEVYRVIGDGVQDVYDKYGNYIISFKKK